MVVPNHIPVLILRLYNVYSIVSYNSGHIRLNIFPTIVIINQGSAATQYQSTRISHRGLTYISWSQNWFVVCNNQAYDQCNIHFTIITSVHRSAEHSIDLPLCNFKKGLELIIHNSTKKIITDLLLKHQYLPNNVKLTCV